MDIQDFSLVARFSGKDNLLVIRGRRPDAEKGLRWLSFYMADADIKVWKSSVFNETLTDCNHKLNICGDRIVFFDMEMPYCDDAGEMKVPYFAMHFPLRARRIIARIAEYHFKRMRAKFVEGSYDNETDFEIRFNPVRLAKLFKKYGQTKGRVEVHIDSSIEARVEVDSEDSIFVARLNHLKQIARNSTTAPEHTAHLYLYRDGEGYYWRATSPKNRQLMVGGLINHGIPGGPEWMIHT